MLKFLSLICICFCLSGAISQNIYKQKTYLMGSDFEITVVAKTQLEADKQIAIAIGEISRIEALISSWKPTSETSNINKTSHICPLNESNNTHIFFANFNNIRIISEYFHQRRRKNKH